MLMPGDLEEKVLLLEVASVKALTQEYLWQCSNSSKRARVVDVQCAEGIRLHRDL